MVTMAGESRRFQDAGIHVPKWSLELGGQSMLAHAVESLRPILDDDATLTFVALDEDVTRERLDRCRRSLSYESTVVWVPEVPPGQAWSADAGCAGLPEDEPVVVWNVDTAVEPSALVARPEQGAWLSLMEQPGTHWSFAQVDADSGLVTGTAEKERISGWASTGLYAFASVAQLRQAVREGDLRGLHRGDELYLAPLYNLLIEAGEEVWPHFVDADVVTPMGTPEEVRSACRRRGWALPPEFLS